MMDLGALKKMEMQHLQHVLRWSEEVRQGLGAAVEITL